MFVRYFVELSLPSDDVEKVLVQDPASWIPGIAGRADERGTELLTEVGIGAEHLAHASVALEFGALLKMPSKTLLPFRWTAVGGGGLLPALEGDIEVARLGANMTQLAVNAQYEPPFGALGRAIDRILMHRVAEATLKDFLDRISETLAERVHALR